jgi:hypothetical protein
MAVVGIPLPVETEQTDGRSAAVQTPFRIAPQPIPYLLRTSAFTLLKRRPDDNAQLYNIQTQT